MQRDHAGPAVAEDPRNGVTRSEPGEAIRLFKPQMAAGSEHAEHMPRFRALSGPLPAASRASKSAAAARVSPTHFHEEPKQCCEAKTQGADRKSPASCSWPWSASSPAAILFGIASVARNGNSGGAGPRRVWSPEHGHYHSIPQPRESSGGMNTRRSPKD